jgi:hypothetical protein
MSAHGYSGFGSYAELYGGGGFGGYDGFEEHDDGGYDGVNDFYGYGSFGNYDLFAGHYGHGGGYGVIDVVIRCLRLLIAVMGCEVLLVICSRDPRTMT